MDRISLLDRSLDPETAVQCRCRACHCMGLASRRFKRRASLSSPRLRQETRMDVLYLVRHGETEWNRQQRMQGRLDSRLTEEGPRARARCTVSCWRARRSNTWSCRRWDARAKPRTLILAGLRHSGDVRRAPGGASLRRVGRADDRRDRRAVSRGMGRARSLDPFHHRPPAGENLPDMLQRIAPLAERLATLPRAELADRVARHQRPRVADALSRTDTARGRSRPATERSRLSPRFFGRRGVVRPFPRWRRVRIPDSSCTRRTGRLTPV